MGGYCGARMGRTLLSTLEKAASGVNDDEVYAEASRVKAGFSSIYGEVPIPYPLIPTYWI